MLNHKYDQEKQNTSKRLCLSKLKFSGCRMMEDPESQADVCCQGVLSKTFMGLCPCSVVLVEAVAASDSKKKKVYIL